MADPLIVGVWGFTPNGHCPVISEKIVRLKFGRMKISPYLCVLNMNEMNNIITTNVIDILIVDLIILLNKVNKSTFIHLLTEVPVRMNKTGNPYFGKVTKVSSCNYLIGNGYIDRMGTGYEKSGLDISTFDLESNKVGKHVSKVVLYNEKLKTHYIQVERFDEIKPKNTFYFEGQEIDKSLFDQWVIKPSQSKKQEQDKYISFIHFKLDNVKEITIDKTKYRVIK